MVKDAEFDIELLDPKPPNIKMRPLSPVKKAFLHWRIQYLIYVPKETTANQRLSVQQPKSSRTLPRPHGSNAITALMDPANQVEVQQFFRLTQDFRALNLC